jgi:hypothetical protein
VTVVDHLETVDPPPLVLRTPRSSMIRVSRATRAGRALRQPCHGHAARPDASSRDKREERACRASSLVHPAPRRARPSPSSVCRTLLCMVGRNRAPPNAVSRRRRVCPVGYRMDLPRVPPPLLHPCDTRAPVSCTRTTLRRHRASAGPQATPTVVDHPPDHLNTTGSQKPNPR